MLRALLEREIVPDLVLGTSVGALNGAMVARQPHVDVIDRLTELWAATAQQQATSTATARCARSAEPSPAAPTSTPRDPCARGSRRSWATRPSRTSRSRSGSARPASNAPRSTGSPPGRSCPRSSPAPPYPACSHRRASRPSGEHFLDGGLVNSIPVGRAVELGAEPDLRPAGGPDRPPPHGPQAPVGGRPGQLRGRPPPPLHARHGHDPRGRGDARPARGRHVDPRRLGAQPPRLRQRPATHRCVVRRLPRLPGRGCDPPGAGPCAGWSWRRRRSA